MKNLILYTFILLLFSACTEKKHEIDIIENTEHTPQIDIIKVEYACCVLGEVFYIYFNVHDKSILYNIDFMFNEPISVYDYSIIKLTGNEYLKLDDISLIKDTILQNFKKIDFGDVINNDINDGYGINLIFAFDNDSILKINIGSCAMTPNQQRLITEIFNQIINHSKNQTNVKYFEDLKESIKKDTINYRKYISK